MSFSEPMADEVGCQVNLITGEHYGLRRGSCQEVLVNSRITRDEMLMTFARVASKRGTCTRLAVGAVIAREGRIISTGYVGSPPGIRHCTEVGCNIVDGHCVRTSHAEMNALLFAAQCGIATQGAEMYITHSPCYTCAKAIVTAGIVRVMYGSDYSDQSVKSEVAELLCRTNVKYNGPYSIGEAA